MLVRRSLLPHSSLKTCYSYYMNHSYYKNNTHTFPEQTHFIGVLVPQELTETLLNCRNWMNAEYGCRSGYGTPIHITLVPPFHLNDNCTTTDVTKSVQLAIEDLLRIRTQLPFTAHVNGFGAFGDRTIFAKVLFDEHWQPVRDAVLKSLLTACPGTTKKDARPFTPHLTVANRDIPEGALVAALEHFSELNLVSEFPVNTIAVFTRNRGIWYAEESNILRIK